jgi:hypothetical protein
MGDGRQIFVGSSSEGLEQAARIAASLTAAGSRPVLWNAGAFPAGRTLLEQIERLPCDYDGAVLVVTPDVASVRAGRRFRAPAANVVFDGLAMLSIPPRGHGGTGLMYGSTFVTLGGYTCRIDVVNEIREARVSRDGRLRLRLETVRREITDEQGAPPAGFPRGMRRRDFEVELAPIDGAPGELTGRHTYSVGTELFSAARERYVALDSDPERR